MVLEYGTSKDGVLVVKIDHWVSMDAETRAFWILKNDPVSRYSVLSFWRNEGLKQSEAKHKFNAGYALLMSAEDYHRIMVPEENEWGEVCP